MAWAETVFPGPPGREPGTSPAPPPHASPPRASPPNRADTDRSADPYRAYRRVGGALALLFLVVTLAEWARNVGDPINRDFIAFWGAARLAIAGQAAAAYDGAALHAVQAAAATFHGGESPFPYPPAFLILALPFGWLPYPAALAAWAAATFVAFLACVRRMFARSGWLALAFPPVLINAAIGQSGFAVAAIFIGGLWLLPRRPFAAGLLLGCLILKPQLAVMLPVAMVAGRHWRAVAGAAASSVGVMTLGLLLFGRAATLAWADQMRLFASIARDGLVGWHKMASVYASARQAGLEETAAFGLHSAVAAGAAWAVWRVWRSEAEPLGKAAALAAATMLASPYVFGYDATLLIAPLLWLAARGVSPAAIGALWCLPLVTIAQTYASIGAVNLGPVVPIALLILSLRRCREDVSPPMRAT